MIQDHTDGNSKCLERANLVELSKGPDLPGFMQYSHIFLFISLFFIVFEMLAESLSLQKKMI